MRPLALLHLLRGEPEVARDLLERTLAAAGSRTRRRARCSRSSSTQCSPPGVVGRARGGRADGLARAAPVGAVPARAGRAGAREALRGRGASDPDPVSTRRCGTSPRPGCRSTPPGPSWSWPGHWSPTARRPPPPGHGRARVVRAPAGGPRRQGRRSAASLPRRRHAAGSAQPRDPHPAGGRGTRAGRPRPQQRPDRGAAVHQPEDTSSTTWAGSWPSSDCPAGPAPSPTRPPSRVRRWGRAPMFGAAGWATVGVHNPRRPTSRPRGRNAELVRRLFDAYEANDAAQMDELLAPDFIDHGLRRNSATARRR